MILLLKNYKVEVRHCFANIL